MNVVVADADDRLVALLQASLEAAGHTVFFARDSAGLKQLLDEGGRDLAIADVDVDTDRVVAALREWAELAGDRARGVLLIGVSSGSSERVRKAVESTNAIGYLSKPFAFFDLEDHVAKFQREHRPRQPAAKPSPPPKTSGVSASDSGVSTLGAQAASRVDASLPRAMRMLAKVWASGSTGVLRVVGEQGPERSFVIADGGFVEGHAWAMVSAELKSAALVFEPRAVAGQGNAEALGVALFETARMHGDANVLGDHRFDRIGLACTPMSLATLPLQPCTLAALGDSSASVAHILSEAGDRAPIVSAEVAALFALGLVEFHPRDVRAQKTTGARAEVVKGVKPTRQVDERRRARVEHGSPVPSGGANRDFPSTTIPSTSSVSGGRGRIGAALRAGTAKGRTRRSAKRGATPGPSPAQLHRQLNGELKRLADASPPVVLGIPSDADLALIEEAAARLKRRYSDLSRRSDVPVAVREIGRKLLLLVESAHEAMARRAKMRPVAEAPSMDEGPASGPSAPVAEEERLLQAGRAFIAEGRWEDADKVLTRARDLCLGHAGILSELGWARFHSPTRSAEERQEEARDLMLLAAQFGGAKDAELQRRLARVHLSAGMLDKANICCAIAEKLDPGAAANANLRRELDDVLPPTTT